MSSRWLAALSGVAAGATTLAVAEESAAVMLRGGATSGTASPPVPLARAFRDRAPAWLKDVAIRTVGPHDKLVLLVGMGLVLTGLCAVIGLTGGRSKPPQESGSGGPNLPKNWG